MAAQDIYHDTVRTALLKHGWTITDDPLRLKIGARSVYVDLGTGKLFAAEKEECKRYGNEVPSHRNMKIDNAQSATNGG